jgi:hypothetical protein
MGDFLTSSPHCVQFARIKAVKDARRRLLGPWELDKLTHHCRLAACTAHHALLSPFKP